MDLAISNFYENDGGDEAMDVPEPAAPTGFEPGTARPPGGIPEGLVDANLAPRYVYKKHWF